MISPAKDHDRTVYSNTQPIPGPWPDQHLARTSPPHGRPWPAQNIAGPAQGQTSQLPAQHMAGQWPANPMAGKWPARPTHERTMTSPTQPMADIWSAETLSGSRPAQPMATQVQPMDREAQAMASTWPVLGQSMAYAAMPMAGPCPVQTVASLWPAEYSP
jgi:hypothetical protein